MCAADEWAKGADPALGVWTEVHAAEEEED